MTSSYRPRCSLFTFLFLLLLFAEYIQFILVESTSIGNSTKVLFEKFDASFPAQTSHKLRSRLSLATRTKVNHLLPSSENKLEYNRAKHKRSLQVPFGWNMAPTFWEWKDDTSQVQINESNVGLGQVIQQKRKNEGSRVLPTSNIAGSQVEFKPLSCYQCKSSIMGESCTGWVELRRSEKYLLRTACTLDMGSYCFKSVTQNRTGHRLSIRGCYGPGPLKTRAGGALQLREGCIRHHPNDDSLTTVCFCKKHLCNSAAITSFTRNSVFLVVAYLLIVLKT